MDECDIPAIDLGDWRGGDRTRIAATVDRALRATGFLVVRGHGVPGGLAAELRERCLAFFHLPARVKAQYASASGVPGWHGFRTEASARVYGVDGPPDLREALMFVAAGGTTLVSGTGEFAARNVPVAEVPGLVPAAERYIAATERLSRELLGLLGAALGDVDGRLHAGTDRAMASLSVNWYPPLAAIGAVAPGQFRAGPHKDYGTITVLDRQPGAGCLQVQQADGSWVDAPHEPGALIVNLGDLMAHWTGGRWRSSVHRVLPPQPTAANEELTSLVYFVESNLDAVIEVFPPPIGGGRAHPPVAGGAWLRDRLAAVAV